MRPRPRRWQHWTLRSRLAVSIVALAAVALVVADVAGVVLLRTYLTSKVDEQLARMVHMPYRPPGPTGSMPRPPLPPYEGVVLRHYRDGTLLASSGDDAAGPQLGSFTEIAARAGGPPYTVDSGGRSWRVLVAEPDRDGVHGVGAIALDQVHETAGLLLVIGLAVTGLVLVLLAVTAAAVVRLGLRPLTRMEDAAAAIAGGDLARRAPDADPHTEPGRLGLAVNAMLARIEAALAAREASEQRLRQFVADASHELRTPLTSIRGFAELYRRGGMAAGPELDESMRRIEDEAARMGVLVDDLLLLAALDEERPLERRPVDLLEIAADAVRDANARAPDRAVRLASFEPVTVVGDEARLRQVTTNLLSNGLAHTPADANVFVRVGRRRAADPWQQPVVAAVGAPLPPGVPVGVLEVSDTGPGVPPEHAPRVFERLYRADPSRTRGAGTGSGLGLSIVAAIVAAHGGRVELVSSPRTGTTFRVLLPTHSVS